MLGRLIGELPTQMEDPKQSPNSGEENVTPEPQPLSETEKIQKENAQQWFKRVIVEKGVDGLRKEFWSLYRPLDPNSYKAFEHQPSKAYRNRYRDVVCLDKTRVVLKNAKNDYINANYVDSPAHPKRFICSQGPTETTCGDFWRMVVQEGVEDIFMLCNLFEDQMPKCAPYFPEKIGQSLTFDGFTVECRGQKKLELPAECVHGIEIQINDLEVKNDAGNVHTCNHYQWISWPDHGVPASDLTAVHLLTAAQLVGAVRPSKQPIIIHCSAGIGRTGSLTLLHNLIELYLLGQPFSRTDEILLKIREQRAWSVQTDLQYLFVQRVFLEYLFDRNSFETSQFQHIRKFIDDYTRATQ